MSKSAVKVSRNHLLKSIENGSVKLIPFSEMKINNSADENDINSEVKKIITSILADVINIPAKDISGDSHIIFDLGADSIAYFSFISRCAEKYPELNLSDPNALCYTVNDLCKYLERTIF